MKHSLESAKNRIIELVGDNNIDFKWYCVEDGMSEEECRICASDIKNDRIEVLCSKQDFNPIY